MAAYAEGLGILRSANVGKRGHAVDAETTPLRDPEHYQYDLNLPDIAEVWRRGSVIASWLLDLIGGRAHQGPGAQELRRAGCPIRARGGGRSRPPSTRRCRRPFSRARCTSASARAAKRTSADKLLSAMRYEFGGHLEKVGVTRTRDEQRAFRRARVLWRHRRSRVQEDLSRAAGDGEARPPRRAGHRRGEGGLEPSTSCRPGPRTASRSTAGWIPRPSDSLCRLLRYVDGDYQDPATFQAIRKALGSAQRPAHYLAIPPVLFGTVVEQLAKAGCDARRPRHRREAVRPRRRLRAGAQPGPARRFRRDLDLPDRSLPRQAAGAQHALLPLRQRLPRAVLESPPRRERADHHGRRLRRSRAAAPSTTRPAPSATWSRTISSRS